MVEVPLAVVRSLKATLDAYSILEDSVSRAEAANQAMMDAITAVAPQEPEEPQEVASSPEAKRLSESERHRLFQQCEKLEGILHEREVAKATKEKRRKAMAKQKPKAVAKKKAQCKPKAKAKARSAAAKRRGAAKKKEVAKKDTKSKEKNKDKGNAKSKRQDDTSKKLHSVYSKFWHEAAAEGRDPAERRQIACAARRQPLGCMQKRQAYDEKLAKDREREELVEGGPSGGYSKQQVQAPMARVKTAPTFGSKRQGRMRTAQPGSGPYCPQE
ncbi:Hypothetical protein SCF082_LOCUS15370, partial [Durusdinium trenchii]